MMVAAAAVRIEMCRMPAVGSRPTDWAAMRFEPLPGAMPAVVDCSSRMIVTSTAAVRPLAPVPTW